MEFIFFFNVIPCIIFECTQMRGNDEVGTTGTAGYYIKII